MSRLGVFVATCAVAVSAWIGVSHYAFADDRAEQLSAQAGKLMFADPPQYEKAIDLYRQAIVLSPEGKYYFNLCVAYAQLGELDLALQACDIVETLGPDSALEANNKKMTGRIEDQIRALGKDPADIRRANAAANGGGSGTGSDVGTGTGSSTGTGTGTGGGGGEGSGSNMGTGQTGAPPPLLEHSTVRGAVQPALFVSKPPSHDYVWSLGGEVYGFGASFGTADHYGKGGAGFRLHGDYMLLPKLKLGATGYLGFNSVSTGTGFTNDGLSVVDLGLGAYMHVACFGRMCVTPLVGLQIGGMQPDSVMNNQVQYVSFGARAELGLSYAFGSKYEHVISLTPGVQVYSPATGSSDAGTAADFDLNHSGSVVYFGLGYTRRFDTPFGQAPFITLQ